MQLDCVLYVLDWCQWVGSTGVVGANATIRLSEAPVRLHYTFSIYHSLYSNWEGLKDSSISADGGHERGGMGGGLKCHVPIKVLLYIYTSPEASCVSKIPTQYCVYTHG